MIHQINKPFIISGAHRSGTTWLGKCLSLSKEAFLLSEPFSPRNKFFPDRVPFTKEWFQFIEPEQYDIFKKQIEFGLGKKYPLSIAFHQLINCRTTKNFVGVLARLKKFKIAEKENKQIIVKDPNLVFNVHELNKRYDLNFGIIYRHPAAFIASVDRMRKHNNWDIKLKDLILNQSLPNYITKNHIDEINMAIKSNDFIIEAATYWKVMYSYLLKFMGENNFIFINHEQLSLNPIREFSRIFTFLDMPFTKSIENKILELTQGSNPVNANKGEIHNFKRNSAELINTWKTHFSEKEISTINSITQDVFHSLQQYKLTNLV